MIKKTNLQLKITQSINKLCYPSLNELIILILKNILNLKVMIITRYLSS